MLARLLCSSFAVLLLVSSVGAQPWVVYPGGDGLGKGKHIVLISGDEEYRSEEALPQLGKILSTHLGFKCTVLFAIDHDGTINPNRSDNIPGLAALKTADLIVLGLRFRDLPDDQMQNIVDYIDAGKPVVGLRTSTHSFKLRNDSKFADYSFNSKTWQGGFGRQVLGETWIAHHGAHGKESTRGIIVENMQSHPILRGIKNGDIWGPTDVYTVRLPDDCQPLVLGQVLTGMSPTDPPLEGAKNTPMMPIAWTKIFMSKTGAPARVFTTTMGAASDLPTEGTRRLIVNGCLWAIGLDGDIPERTKVDLVGKFEPTPFKFNGFVKGIRPDDHRLAQ